MRSVLAHRRDHRLATRWLSSDQASKDRLQERSVVVTGLGVVTPLGCGVETAWSRLCEGSSSASALLGENFSKVASRVACLVPREESKNT